MPPPAPMDTQGIVEDFVNTINGGHAEAIASRMGGGRVFIDSLGRRIEGAQALSAAWRGYLQLFPDYRIETEAILVDERRAMLHGWASATLHRGGGPVEGGGWRIPAAWRAETDSRRVLLWQVYADNKPVYALLEK